MPSAPPSGCPPVLQPPGLEGRSAEGGCWSRTRPTGRPEGAEGSRFAGEGWHHQAFHARQVPVALGLREAPAREEQAVAAPYLVGHAATMGTRPRCLRPTWPGWRETGRGRTSPDDELGWAQGGQGGPAAPSPPQQQVRQVSGGQHGGYMSPPSLSSPSPPQSPAEPRTGLLPGPSGIGLSPAVPEGPQDSPPTHQGHRPIPKAAAWQGLWVGELNVSACPTHPLPNPLC